MYARLRWALVVTRNKAELIYVMRKCETYKEERGALEGETVKIGECNMENVRSQETNDQTITISYEIGSDHKRRNNRKGI